MGSLWTQSLGDFQILLRSGPNLVFSECVLCLSLSGLYMPFAYGALLSTPHPHPWPVPHSSYVAFTTSTPCSPSPPAPRLYLLLLPSTHAAPSFVKPFMPEAGLCHPSLTLAKTLLPFLSHFKCISPCVKWRYWIVSSLKTHISIIFVFS